MDYEFEKQFLDKNAKYAKSANKIDLKHYENYNVKRGLRNSDGTGVLVGLTEIGDVHGYIVDEKEKVPVEGSLKYRGIDLLDLCSGFLKEKRFGFEETVYLLLFGKLPDKDNLSNFKQIMSSYRDLPSEYKEISMKAPSRNIMNKLARSVLFAYSYDRNPEGRTLKTILRQCIELVAKFPVMIAYGYQAKIHNFDNQSLVIHRPDENMGTAENFLRLIRPDGAFSEVEAEILDLALVVHAEHGGGNNSSFTTHVVMSSDTDIYSAIAAAIGSLKGLKHGGANIRVIEMMEDISRNVSNWTDEKEIEEYLARIIRKQAFDRTGLVYGMGHAVYTKSDPRAEIFKKKVEELVSEKGYEREFELYKNVEKITPQVFADVKKSDKVISANVDFYSGFVYKILGIPTDLYTPMFAMARIAGWSAHALEEIASGGRIIRPAYKSVAKRKPYIPLDER
ncbi:2-methylcitrate synthase 1 [Sedimentisphaera cyanobacteriorum]|uniref:Citrate synthase n=1 Tax=Sedimentisphaera cyanobacteriorum TaxID=1940790 RepID=A0A1Q2HMY9_9BACT|nr:citrate/2-methylcitrate synthase [Sedimentisphaera cyanobacteriorum]AQQ08812.1 2-methylcitrate synthase 1 [Sedimentisphaera cyanobacteriorum]